MWSIWIKELFINIAILITIVFIGSQSFMKTGINKQSSYKIKIGLGILGSVLGIVLMTYTIIIPPQKVFIDMRNIALIITSLYGGPISTFIVASMLSLFRIFWGGIGRSALIGVMNIVVIGLFCTFISMLDYSKLKKWALMLAGSIIISSIGLIVTIINEQMKISVLIVYIVSFFIANVLTYILTENLERDYYMIKNLKFESSIDHLTGLKNVRFFDKVFNEEIEKIKNHEGGHIALLTMDIDNFKDINDTYGHHIGDLVLKGLGKVILKNIREDDTVARVGGEEFSIILPNSNAKDALEIGERIRSKIEEHDFYINDTDTVNITVSIGGGVYPDTIKDITMIKEESDKNLYKAKKLGKNKLML